MYLENSNHMSHWTPSLLTSPSSSPSTFTMKLILSSKKCIPFFKFPGSTILDNYLSIIISDFQRSRNCPSLITDNDDSFLTVHHVVYLRALSTSSFTVVIPFFSFSVSLLYSPAFLLSYILKICYSSNLFLSR